MQRWEGEEHSPGKEETWVQWQRIQRNENCAGRGGQKRMTVKQQLCGNEVLLCWSLALKERKEEQTW